MQVVNLLLFIYVHVYDPESRQHRCWGWQHAVGNGFVLHEFPEQVVTAAHSFLYICARTGIKRVTASILVTPWPRYAQVPAHRRDETEALLQAGGQWATEFRHLSTAEANVARILAGTVPWHLCGEDVGTIRVPELFSRRNQAAYYSPPLHAAPRTFTAHPSPQEIVAHVLGNALVPGPSFPFFRLPYYFFYCFLYARHPFDFPEWPKRQYLPLRTIPGMSGGPIVARGASPQGWSPAFHASVVMQGFLPFPVLALCSCYRRLHQALSFLPSRVFPTENCNCHPSTYHHSLSRSQESQQMVCDRSPQLRDSSRWICFCTAQQ